MVVALAVMAWKCLICVTGTESPVVVVLSGSMEPGFQRGDILFLNMGKEPIRAGEIVVFNFNRSEIPIVHRVIELHERQDTREISILTKGDNNDENDRVLYAKGHLWLQKQHIMGRAIGFLPYVGWITIVLTEIPVIKVRHKITRSISYCLCLSMPLFYWINDFRAKYMVVCLCFVISSFICISIRTSTCPRDYGTAAGHSGCHLCTRGSSPSYSEFVGFFSPNGTRN
ncbi:signal peptidase complex catalytic subunit SEC11A-like isoform X5 [Zingiber officinale]|nr:signal peptidase complex catalytic subunit SEC11A-like isoform X5 [Zingiber officinale]